MSTRSLLHPLGQVRPRSGGGEKSEWARKNSDEEKSTTRERVLPTLDEWGKGEESRGGVGVITGAVFSLLVEGWRIVVADKVNKHECPQVSTEQELDWGNISDPLDALACRGKRNDICSSFFQVSKSSLSSWVRRERS